MTKSATTSRQTIGEASAPPVHEYSDAAPMVITRLSGWIDVSEIKTELRGWIVPTRICQSAR